MKLELVLRESFTNSTWAHGTTTEMYIYPRDGSYAERRFKWRVSSATVDIESSEFTSLYGVKRWIMSFDNVLHLTHTNNGKALYSITLNAYESHCFRGDWTTVCKGRANDFNLMLKQDSNGIMKATKLLENVGRELGFAFYEAFDDRLPLEGHQLTLGLYSHLGNFQLINQADVFEVPQNTLQLIHFKMDEIDEVKQMIIRSQNSDMTRIAMFVVTY